MAKRDFESNRISRGGFYGLGNNPSKSVTPSDTPIIPPSPGDNWVLENGVWVDSNLWDDSKTWQDEPQ